MLPERCVIFLELCKSSSNQMDFTVQCSFPSGGGQACDTTLHPGGHVVEFKLLKLILRIIRCMFSTGPIKPHLGTNDWTMFLDM